MKNITSAFFIIFSLCFFQNIFSQTDIPNKDMWVTNGRVFAIAVDGNHTYIGGDFTLVGPNTGCGAKLTTTATMPAVNFPAVNGRIRSAVSDGSGILAFSSGQAG